MCIIKSKKVYLLAGLAFLFFYLLSFAISTSIGNVDYAIAGPNDIPVVEDSWSKPSIILCSRWRSFNDASFYLYYPLHKGAWLVSQGDIVFLRTATVDEWNVFWGN